ncbi:hypothetical protein M3Y97_01007800 [Aphelenchoides bicaudatus]|nr:hypothetical protein M3Y97_01007800 [Aphelenchoides bicaudatus]
MFGLIHDSLKQMIIQQHGEDFWLTVLQHAGIEAGNEASINENYPDEVTLSIVGSISVLTRTSCEDIWEAYGEYFVEYVMKSGWDELLRSMSPNLKSFLNNLDSMHYFIDSVAYKAKMRGPSFRCEAQSNDDNITLHYLSTRSGLYPIVKGVLKEIARRIYECDIGITIKGRSQRVVQLSNGERTEEHVIFQIKLSGSQKNSIATMAQGSFEPSTEWSLKVNNVDFAQIMPYHVIVDQECKLVQVGNKLQNYISPDLLEPGTPLLRIFEIHRPQIPLDFDNICNFINAVFVMQSRSIPIIVQQTGSTHALSRNSHSSNGSKTSRGDDFANAQHLKLKGQMMLINNGTHIVYLASPYVTTIGELSQYGLKLSAFPLHDATRDLILMNQQRLDDTKEKFVSLRLSNEKCKFSLALEQNNQMLEEIDKALELESEKLELMLADSLPTQILTSLDAGNAIMPREFDEVTILYADVPSFYSILENYSLDVAIAALSELFTRFDRLTRLHNIFKVNGVGESYIAVGGLPEPSEGHAETILHIGLGMEWKARQVVVENVKNEPLLVRCGIHTGSVIAGLIEVGSPEYCVFGETVTAATQLAKLAPSGCILVSREARQAAQRTGRFEFEAFHGSNSKLEASFLKRSFKKSVWEIINRERGGR